MRMYVLMAAMAAAGCGGCSSWREPAPKAEAPAEAAPVVPAPPAAPVPSTSKGLFDNRTTAGMVWKDYPFDKSTAGEPPAQFTFARTGMGRPGKWVVRAVEGAPDDGQVLVQEDADATDFRFPVAVADEPVSADMRISARVRMVSGEVDRAAGLVLRYVDADNYYVTRANALENNVMLFYVKEGRRIAIGVWNGTVTAGEWHSYEFVAKGDHLLVRWDGNPVLDTRDATITAAGKAGLWTKADSVTQFDSVRVEALVP
jgi:hypothetical protein